MADKKGSNSEKLLYCSFCGKSQHEVKKLIAGPSVFICDECIDLCNEIIRDEAAGAGIEAGLSKSDLPSPQEIREILYLKERLNHLLAHHTGQPVERIARDTDRDNFMSGDDAQAYGLVDQVLHKRP